MNFLINKYIFVKKGTHQTTGWLNGYVRLNYEAALL